MLKTNKIHLAIFFVLVFGLASCGKDGHHIKDVYVPQAIDLETTQEIDLQNRLDLQKQVPARYDVTSYCYDGQRSLHATFNSPNGKPAEFGEILPPEVLFADLQKTSWRCDLVVELWNAVGSSFTKHYGNRLVVDRMNSPVIFAQAPLLDEQHVLFAEERETALINYASEKGTSVQLKCNDWSSTPIAFDHMMKLKSIKLPANETIPGLQSCRFAFAHDGRIEALSPRLDVVLAKRSDVSVSPYLMPRDHRWDIEFGDRPNPYTFAGFSLRNSSNTTLVLKMDPTVLDVPATVYMFENGTKRVGTVPLKASEWQLESTVIEPGHTILLKLFSHPRRLTCPFGPWHWIHTIIGPITPPVLQIGYAHADGTPVGFQRLELPTLNDVVLPESKDINISADTIRDQYPAPNMNCTM